MREERMTSKISILPPSGRVERHCVVLAMGLYIPMHQAAVGVIVDNDPTIPVCVLFESDRVSVDQVTLWM